MSSKERAAIIRALVEGNSLRSTTRITGHNVNGGAIQTETLPRFRYEPRLEKWRLFWADRHGRWHRYELVEPSVDIGSLIAEVERDPTNIFWG